MSERVPRSLPLPLPEHGPHTLRPWSGVIVGIHGEDVFVELGPRMQGVITRRALGIEPRVGDVHRFTLRGQEDTLWVLAREEAPLLASWRDMAQGSLVQARVMRKVPGGLQLKVGPLHAFMPRSHTGLPRGQDVKILVGKTLTCDVIEIDPERQRVLVSRRVAAQNEKASRRQREASKLEVGAVVNGRVTRVEDFGAFVSFGPGLEGLIHVSNLSLERVRHPSEVVHVGQSVQVKVLAIREHGKRIALGLKQMEANPWTELERSHYEGEIVEGVVVRLLAHGALVTIRRGIEGLLPESAMGLGPSRGARQALREGSTLSLRIVELDCAAERLLLSLLHRDGSRIASEEATWARDFAEWGRGGSAESSGTQLGKLLAGLRRASAKPGDDGRERVQE